MEWNGNGKGIECINKNNYLPTYLLTYLLSTLPTYIDGGSCIFFFENDEKYEH